MGGFAARCRHLNQMTALDQVICSHQKFGNWTNACRDQSSFTGGDYLDDLLATIGYSSSAG
eukprot:1618197-Karenia_brevis.AAC.1